VGKRCTTGSRCDAAEALMDFRSAGVCGPESLRSDFSSIGARCDHRAGSGLRSRSRRYLPKPFQAPQGARRRIFKILRRVGGGSARSEPATVSSAWSGHFLRWRDLMVDSQPQPGDPGRRGASGLPTPKFSLAGDWLFREPGRVGCPALRSSSSSGLPHHVAPPNLRRC